MIVSSQKVFFLLPFVVILFDQPLFYDSCKLILLFEWTVSFQVSTKMQTKSLQGSKSWFPVRKYMFQIGNTMMELLPLALLLNIPATAAKLSSHVSWTWNIKKLPISFLHIWQDEYSAKNKGWMKNRRNKKSIQI